MSGCKFPGWQAPTTLSGRYGTTPPPRRAVLHHERGDVVERVCGGEPPHIHEWRRHFGFVQQRIHRNSHRNRHACFSGCIGNSLQLDGSSGYYTLPNINSKFGDNAATLMVLVKLVEATRWRPAIQDS